MKNDFAFLNVEIAQRVATVTIDNPPINIVTLPLYAELMQLIEALQKSRSCRLWCLRARIQISS